MHLRRLGDLLSSIEPWLRRIAYLAGVITLLGYLGDWFSKLRTPITHFIVSDPKRAWIVLLVIWVISLALSFWRYSRRFSKGFSDNFRDELCLHWDTQGKWEKPEKGTLLVKGWGAETSTRSDAGGISKVGALWENYVLSCKFKLIRNCLGVIVRASDLNNYYMFQIGTTVIAPHRRWSSPVFSPPDPSGQAELENQPISGKLFQVGVQIGWQIIDPPTPVDVQLGKWYRLRIKVDGASVSVYINDELFLFRENFLDITMGRIGFRNHGEEEAQVRHVKVKLLP